VTSGNAVATNTDEYELQEPIQLHVLSGSSPDESILSPEQEEHILQLFQLFDTDDSGILDESELHSALFALGYLPSYHENISASTDLNSLRWMDRLGTGVTKDEFRDIMRGSLLGSGGLDEIRMTFDAIVSVQPNLGRKLQNIGIRSMRKYARDSVDQSGNPISMEDDVHEEDISADPNEGMSNLPSNGPNINSSCCNPLPPCNSVFPSVTHKFRKRSQSGNLKARGCCGERITFDNLRLACQRFDVKLSDEELKTMIEETDRDYSGDVDWDEYVNILKNSCWF
jgi:Ca2+-binding EF-hand superfamily protein